MSALHIHKAGPGVTLQDLGRPGYLAQGLSRGGAADVVALCEAAALLNQPVQVGVELAGMGGVFSFSTDMVIALTGAVMPLTIGDNAAQWNASNFVPKGTPITIGAARGGVYGYLCFAASVADPALLGSHSTHLGAGLGRAFQAGDQIALGAPKEAQAGQTLPPLARFGGGRLRVIPSLQTHLFSAEQRARFAQDSFERDARGNRMGVRLRPKAAGYGLPAGQSILSEVIVPGDIQVPGDGAPYILLAECQTTGGYPRLGTVIPADLPRVAQAGPGAELRFEFVARHEALAAQAQFEAALKTLPQKVQPLLRDPRMMADLLAYNLISGVTAG